MSLTAKLHAERLARRGAPVLESPSSERTADTVVTGAALAASANDTNDVASDEEEQEMLRQALALSLVNDQNVQRAEVNSEPEQAPPMRPPPRGRTPPTPPAARAAVDTRSATSASSDREDFDCPLCGQLLVEPLGLLCGHTYCRTCIKRSLTVSQACPLCRVPCFVNASTVTANYLLSKLIARHFGQELSSRILEVEQDEAEIDSQRLGLFVLHDIDIAFPGTPITLNIFEPRYLLLAQRCLDNNTLFGITNSEQSVSGVAARVESVRRVPNDNARLVITAVTEMRYRVLQPPTLEPEGQGLTAAPVLFIKDEPLSTTRGGGGAAVDALIAALPTAARTLLTSAPHDSARATHLRAALATALVRLVSSLSPPEFRVFSLRYGTPPPQPGAGARPTECTPERWSYFAADVLALSPDARRRAVETTSTLERLLICYSKLVDEERSVIGDVAAVSTQADPPTDALDPCVHVTPASALELHATHRRTAVGAADGITGWVKAVLASQFYTSLLILVALLCVLYYYIVADNEMSRWIRQHSGPRTIAY